MSDFKPYPKSQQLARGAKRYRRRVASPKQWQAITAAKIGPCRICSDPASNGRMFGRITFHHVIPRDRFGDDCADNIVPLCPSCHDAVERRGHVRLGPTRPKTLAAVELLVSLSDAEYSYCVERAGEGWAERIYGVRYGR